MATRRVKPVKVVVSFPRGSDMRSMVKKKSLLRLCAVLALGALPFAVRAWVYPEHRQLAILTVQGLDGERRAVFDRLWQDAGAGQQQLCAAGADAAQGTAPTCID